MSDLPTHDTQDSDTTTAANNPLVQSIQKSRETDRSNLPIPEKPDVSELDPITIETPENLSLEPNHLPESWLRYGEHHEASPGESRLFAVAAYISPEQEHIYVRYVHPCSRHAALLKFDAVELEAGAPVPKQAYQSFRAKHGHRDPPSVSFPLSFGRALLTEAFTTTVDPEDAPTTAERRCIWALYPTFLKHRTLYLPPDYL